MIVLALLSLLVSVQATVLNQTTTVTVNVGDHLHGHGHYDDSDYLFGEAIAVLFFIVIIFGCVFGVWGMEEYNRRPPLAVAVAP